MLAHPPLPFCTVVLHCSHFAIFAALLIVDRIFSQLHSFDSHILGLSRHRVSSHFVYLLHSQTIQSLIHVPHELPNILLNDPVWKEAKRRSRLLMQHRCKLSVCRVSAPFNCSEHVLR